ncbi:MAG TPA: LysR family transcriptional regulator [Gaiellaceae bacterium]|jgi:DNA-binding transcriptional LysR family regulator|nr:LysR family transcriptional regulator [Gaiellaceae bacterium]
MVAYATIHRHAQDRCLPSPLALAATASTASDRSVELGFRPSTLQIAIGRPSIELRHLNHFVAVAEEGSFTRASRRLHIVQSAVSASIRSLERELGVELFERAAQGVHLTEEGHVLLPEARLTLAAAAGARDAVDAVSGGLRGRLTVGAMQMLQAVDVPQLLADFHRGHPLVELHLRHAKGGSAELADRVRLGELDLAILSSPERRAPGLELTQIASEAIELVCHKDHPLAARDAVDLADLAEEPFIDFPVGWGVRIAVDAALTSAGVRRAVTMEVDDALHLVRMVGVGLGIALLPPSIVTGPEVRTVPIRHHIPFYVAVAVPTLRRPSAATRAFLETIRSRLA